MRGRTIAIWAMGAALTVAALSALAQQNDGPILLPKPKPAVKPASATLLIMCDLACTWKLDGEAKGSIDAGGSAKAKVELGQHLVVAETADGADQVKQLSEVKTIGQTVVNLELKPVRDARIKAEHPAPHPVVPLPSLPVQVPVVIQAPAPQATPPGPPIQHTLLDGTPVYLRLKQTISSANARVGQEVALEVVGDISVDQVVVLPRGSTAIAKVTAAEPKKNMGRAGKLDMSISFAWLKDQEKVSLRAQAASESKQGTNTGTVAVSTLLFWPSGAYFLFSKGKDVTIDRGTEITAFVNGDMRLDLSKFGAPPPQPATQLAQTSSQVLIAIDSTPGGADIEIDGAFVGNTPSTVATTPGGHQVAVKKKGYTDWTKTLNVTSGAVNLNAQLDPVAAQ